MITTHDDNMLNIHTCPRCAKAGRGMGELRVCLCNLLCDACGWEGTWNQCQDYCFPWQRGRVEEFQHMTSGMRIEYAVFANLFHFALREGEETKVFSPVLESSEPQGVSFTYAPQRDTCEDRDLKGVKRCNVADAFKILVSRGFLEPGIYTVKVDGWE